MQKLLCFLAFHDWRLLRRNRRICIGCQKTQVKYPYDQDT
jgi:hypothetical protein